MSNTPITTTPAPTVAEALVHYLRLEGVTHIFGIPGGGLANMLNEIKNVESKIDYVIARQETGAGYMADGYYRATGKLGVVMVTSGPGATNALTGVMNAQNDGSAVLLITGEVSQDYFGKGYLQEGVDAMLNVDSVYAAALKYSAVYTSSISMQTITEQALRDALSLPRNAVHLSLPDNVTTENLPSNSLPTSTSSYRALPAGASTEGVKEAVKALKGAKQPVIFMGNGCRQAMRDPVIRKQFMHFVESYAIPVMTTADGKGVFPESHELALGVYGIASSQWTYYYMHPDFGQYDGIMVLGSSLGELSTLKWNPMLYPKGPFVQVDINDAVIGRGFPVTQGVVAEVGAFIQKLALAMEVLPPDPKEVAKRRALIKEIKTKYSKFESPEQYNSNSAPLQPAAAMRILQNVMPPNTKIFVDAGNCVGWTNHYLDIDAPQEIFSSLSMGPMGFAVGAVVGGKIGCPDDVVICVTGDGAFMMHGSEVSTAARNKVGAIWMVLYDNDLSMVSQGQAFFFPNEGPRIEWKDMFDFGEPDLVKYSEGLGAQAYRVHDPAELEVALTEAIQNSAKGIPQVIVMHIAEKPVPPYYNPLFS